MSAPTGDIDVYDEINITPMLDLAYVLLIIFIILTTATVQGIKVNLPKASAQPSLISSACRVRPPDPLLDWPGTQTGKATRSRAS